MWTFLLFSIIANKRNICNKSGPQENQPQYLDTIRVWIGEKYNASHAAAKLYIPRTTVLDRMEWIKTLTNLDLNDWDTRIHLMLSYRMMDHMAETDDANAAGSK